MTIKKPSFLQLFEHRETGGTDADVHVCADADVHVCADADVHVCADADVHVCVRMFSA